MLVKRGWKMIRDALLSRGDWIQIPFDQAFTQNYQLNGLNEDQNTL